MLCLGPCACAGCPAHRAIQWPGAKCDFLHELVASFRSRRSVSHGPGGGQPRHTRAVLSAQWWDSRAAYGVGMRVIATFVACARLLHCPPMSQCSPTTSRGSNDVQNSQPVPWMGSIIIGPHSPSLPANLQNLAIPIKLNQAEGHDPRMVRAPAYKLPVNCGNSLQSHHLTIRLVDRSDGSLVNHPTIRTAYDLCSR